MTDYTEQELADFQFSYAQTAIWSSTNPDNDEPLDNGGYEISDELEAEFNDDCERFLEQHAETIRQAETYRNNGSNNFVMAGHDFWLTRCGHGAGFWDGDYSEPHATILDNASQEFGNVDLWVNDNMEICS